MTREQKLQTEYINLIETKYSKFYSVVYRITENYQNTEEALQNAFLAAYKNLNKFQGKSKLSTWLYRIVINESQRFMKNSKNFVTFLAKKHSKYMLEQKNIFRRNFNV